MKIRNGSVNFADQNSNAPRISGDFGETEDRVDTPWAGRKIWKNGKSLMEKSFEMSVGHIVLVVGILALVAGFLSGVKFERSRIDFIEWNGKRWMMVGLIKDNTNNIFFPVYREEEEMRRQMAPK